MTTTDTGRKAESAAAKYLRGVGYEVLAHNWRTRWCEIDLVVQKESVVSFVEVKYRQNDQYGDGLAYITSKKLQQMHFAAELWVSNHKWQGDYALAAVSVAGSDFRVTEFIEL